MKSLKLPVLLFFLLLVQFINALEIIDIDSVNHIYNPYYDFYSENYLGTKSAGRGNTGVASFGSIESSLKNPASMQIASKTDFYYEFGLKHKIKYSTYNGFSPLNNATAGGGIISLGDNWQLGVIYGKKESFNLDLFWAVLEDGYSDVNNQIFIRRTCNTLNIPVSYQANDKLSIGASLNFEFYSSSQSIIAGNYGAHYYKSKADFTIARIKLGTIYKVSNNFNIGISFLTPSSQKISEKVSTAQFNYDENQFPLELITGVSYKLSKIPLNLLAELQYTNTSVYDEMNDRVNFNLGSEYEIKDLVLRLGYLSQLDFRNLDYKDSEEEDYWSDESKEERHLLTLGGSFAWKSLEFSTAYMTSKLLSPNEETLSNLKFSVSLTPPEL